MKDCFDEVYYPEDIIEFINAYTDEKMIDHIRRANQDYMDTPAMTYMGLTFTYRELFQNIEVYARALKAFGLEKGDMITICLPNSPETIFYFYACNDIGVTPYLIDPRCTFGKMKTCIVDSCSKLFVCEMGTYYNKVAGNEYDLQVDKIVVVSPLFSFENTKHLKPKQRIAKMLYKIKQAKNEAKAKKCDKRISQKCFLTLANNSVGEYKTDYDPAIPAIIVNTRGTSGDSVKGAVHSNKSYNIFVNQITHIFYQVNRGDIFYGYIPLFSMYGSSTGMHASLTRGAVLDLIPQFHGEKSIRDFLNKKANVMIGVPALFEKMVDICASEKIAMDFAKLYVLGGDNVTPDKLEKENQILKALGMKHKITYGYGATEVMMISTTSDDKRSHLYGSCGILYPGAKIRIVNPETQQGLDFNEEGEIYIHTPTMMLGYLNKLEENKTVFVEMDGVQYFKTGDKGYLSESGHLFFTGRYKRLMKRPDGHQVSPIPIENAIAKQPTVADCAVVGIKVDISAPGVIPTAFIKLNQGISGGAETIREIAKESLKELSGEREMALAFKLVDTIPYTENGKMNYRALETSDFTTGEYYIVDDPITREVFKDFPNVITIKL